MFVSKFLSQFIIFHSNLNGAYLAGDYKGVYLESRGINWQYWKGFSYSYKRVHMMVRPK